MLRRHTLAVNRHGDSTAVSELGRRNLSDRCGNGDLRDIRGFAYLREARLARGEAGNGAGETPSRTGRAPGVAAGRKARRRGARVSGCGSAGVERPGRTQAEPEQAEELDRRRGPVAAAMQVAQPVEPLDREGEDRQ